MRYAVAFILGAGGAYILMGIGYSLIPYWTGIALTFVGDWVIRK